MHHINYPSKLTLAASAKVMYLNNDQFKHRLYNSFIGVIIKYIIQKMLKLLFYLMKESKSFMLKKIQSSLYLMGC